MAGTSWGINPKHLWKMYIFLLRSHLDYGSFLYGDSCEAHLCKLDKSQNQAMRIIDGFIKTTPIQVLSSELYTQIT